MNLKELRELIEFLIEKDVAEFELERGDVKVKIKRKAEAPPMPAFVHAAPMAAAPAHPAPAHAAAPAEAPPAAAPTTEEGLHTIKSPIVGTFYEAPSPGSPPFVKVGDAVEEGQVLCIIEAMKLMNEIESDSAGEVVKKLIANGQPVEYGQPLFVIRPRK
jgi:acetyl-CoA carboxylase biotin carboxyl carrier protein